MNTGIIVLHCWEEMLHPIELQVMENIKTLLSKNKLPVLGSMITRQDIRQLIPNCVAEDLMEIANKKIVRQWLIQHEINNVVLIGLHYNLCMRQLESRLYELCQDMGKDWNNDFTVQVIEDCTAAAMEDEVYTMQQYKNIGETHSLITLEKWIMCLNTITNFTKKSH